MMNLARQGQWTLATVVVFCFLMGLSFSASAEEGDHKLLINKLDLEKLGIKESAGSYNAGEKKDTLLPSTYSKHYDFKGTTQIKPGWWARCGGNFVLKGLGPGTADVQVALDADTHHHEMISSGSEKVYNVVDHVDGGNLGSHRNLSDVGMVANHSKQAVVEMRCYK